MFLHCLTTKQAKFTGGSSEVNSPAPSWIWVREYNVYHLFFLYLHVHVKITFDTVPTWMSMHEIQRIPFFFLYLHVKIILEPNHNRNAYKIYKLFIFINVRFKLGPEVGRLGKFEEYFVQWPPCVEIKKKNRLTNTRFCRSIQIMLCAELERKKSHNLQWHYTSSRSLG
jgi:hypothetical protein